MGGHGRSVCVTLVGNIALYIIADRLLMNRVFVSYSRKNETIAERIARDLGDAGLDVWFDRRQIHGGELWEREIMRGLERAEFGIVCLSPDAIASEWVRREVRILHEADKPVYPVIVSNVDATLAAIQTDDALRWLLDIQYIVFVDRYQAAFVDLLKSLPGGRARTVFDEVDPESVPNPFKGLEAFQQRDAAFFFGREEMVARALRHLRTKRFLAVVGASGSGKSSLVRAGIIPQIRQGALRSGETSPIIIFSPGANPMQAFAERLHPLLNQPGPEDYTATEIATELHQPDALSGMIDTIRSHTPDMQHLIIVVDQFEEAFTHAAPAETRTFIDVLVAAVQDVNADVRIIITMRADFFGNLSEYPGFAALFEQENLLIVTEMTTANLLRAIEGPVQAVGMSYEAGLVDRILEDVKEQPGSLPLLQYALRELFKRRDGLKLTNAAYDEIGGVRSALARHAESIFTNQTPDDQQLIKRLLLRLIEVNENGEITRRRVSRDELDFRGVPAESIQRIIDLLTAPDARLIVASREIRSDQEQPQIWLEISHEALIHQWDRFKAWVTADLDELAYDSELRRAAADWEASGREVAYLLTGRRLTRAEIWLEQAEATDRQRAFIEASMKRRDELESAERERMQRELELQRVSVRRARLALSFFIMLSVALIAGGIFAAFTINRLNETTEDLSRTSDQLREQSVRARSLAVSSSAEQALQNGDTDLSLALALQASQTGAVDVPPQVQRALSEIGFAPGTRQRVETADVVAALDIDGAGTVFAAGYRDGTLAIYDALTPDEPLDTVRAFNTAVVDVAISTTGRYIVASGRAEIYLLDRSDGTSVNVPYTSRGYETLAFLDDDRIFMGGSDGTLIIADTATLLTTASISDAILSSRAESSAITAVTVYAPDHFAYGTANGGVVTVNDNVYNPRSFENAPRTTVTALAYAPDGVSLLVGYTDGTLLRTEGNTVVTSLQLIDVPISGLATIPAVNQVSVIAGDRALRIYDIQTLRQLLTINTDADLLTIAAGPSDRQIITGTRSTQLRVWDVAGSAEIARYDAQSGSRRSVITTAALSPDKTMIAAGSDNSTVFVWDANTGTEIARLNLAGVEQMMANDVVSSLDFSPDGQRLVVSANSIGTSLSTVSVWDMTTFTRVIDYGGHENVSVTAVRFHPDGTRIASGATDGVIHLWDAATGETQQIFTGHEAGRTITSLAFSPSGDQLVSGSADRTALLWNVQTALAERRYVGHTGTIRDVDIDPVRGTVATVSTDNTARLWDLETARELQRYEAHGRTVYSVRILQQTGDILTAGADGTIRLWDTDSGLELRRYEIRDASGREIRIFNMDVSPDAATMLTTLGDNTVRTWRLIPERSDLVDWIANNRFVRELNCREQLLFNVTDFFDQPAIGEQRFVEAEGGSTRLRPAGDLSATIAILTNGTVVRPMAPALDMNGTPMIEVCATVGDTPTQGFIPAADMAPAR